MTMVPGHIRPLILEGSCRLTRPMGGMTGLLDMGSWGQNTVFPDVVQCVTAALELSQRCHVVEAAGY
jgi:hypothetical protein